MNVQKYISVVIFIILGLFSNTISSQCAYNNAAYLDLTPTGVGNTQSSSCTWAGDYNTVTVCNGAQYTIETCGTSFDTRITIYDATGTTVLADQDADNCSGADESLTYTATFSGDIHILMDIWDCSHNSTCGSMSVTQVTACSGGGGGGPGDDCGNPDRIDCGDPALTGETTIGNSDTESAWACTMLTTGGEDHFYVVQWPDAANPGTIRVQFTNVIDDDTYMEVLSLGSSCAPNACSENNQMDVATGVFGTGNDFIEFNVLAGITDYYFVIDSQGDGVTSYDMEVTCFLTGIELDQSSGCAPIPAGQPANQGYYQTWDGVAPPATATATTMTGTYTICENVYIMNTGWEWLKYFDVTLGACWTNPTNFAPDGAETGFFATGHAACSGNVGGLTGRWDATLTGNVISWAFTHPWRRNPPCVDVTAYGDGNQLNSNYSCALYTFCYDANVDPACSDLDGFKNGISATDDGIGSGGGTVNPSNVSITQTSPTILPVELLSFYAKADKIEGKDVVVLNWVTQTELNNDFFTIERSINGRDFEEVARLAGAGTSSDKSRYYAIDENPNKGVSYYRLKQTDFNGDFKYFDIVAVTIANLKDVKLFPNPVQSELNLSFNLENSNTETVIKIYDVVGGLVYQANQKTEKGFNEIAIDMNNLSLGMYFITLENDGELQKIKLIKE